MGDLHFVYQTRSNSSKGLTEHPEFDRFLPLSIFNGHQPDFQVPEAKGQGKAETKNRRRKMYSVVLNPKDNRLK